MSAEAFACRSNPSGWLTLLWAFFTAFQLYWFATDPDWLDGVMLTGYILMLALNGMVWLNRKRPILEIRDDEIRYARSPFGRLRRVPLREIAGIQIARWRKATLRLRSGRPIVVNLKLIEGIERERAASALERAAGSGITAAPPARV